MHAPSSSHRAAHTRSTTSTHTSNYRQAKHRARRSQSTASFMLVLMLTVSMLLSMVPQVAWAEVTERYATVGELLAEQLGVDLSAMSDRPAEEATDTDTTVDAADAADPVEGEDPAAADEAPATDPADPQDEPAPADESQPEDAPAPASDADAPTFTYTDDAVSVTATLAYPGSLPEGAELEASPITPEDPSYADYLTTADQATAGGVTAENTLLYDLRFMATVDGERVEVEPEGPVSVHMTFNQAQLTSGIDAERGGDVQVTHLLDDGSVELMDAEVAVEAEGATADEAAFTTDSFSVFAFSYTVDVTYGGFTYSFPGQGSYALTDVLAALGIEATVDDASLALVAGDEVEGALYLTQPDGAWYLNSDVPFSSTYELTVASGHDTYVITVTDVSESTDLKNFLTDFTVKGAALVDGKYQVYEGETYKLEMFFAENSSYQFANTSELTLDWPSGILVEDLSDNLPINITYEDKATGEYITVPVQATYKVTGEGDNRKLVVKFDESDANFSRLASATNVSFHFNYDAQFNKNGTDGDLFEKVNREIVINGPKPGDAYVNKTATYDEHTGAFTFTVTVTASGDVTNVHVTDTIHGDALTFDRDSVVIGSSAGTTPETTSSSTTKDDGFDYTFTSMAKDEVITITYKAQTNFGADSNNDGKIDYSQTQNTVTSQVPEQPPHSAEYSREIEYRSTTKNNGELTETLANGDKIISWTVTYNDLAVVSAKGTTISDSIKADSTDYMSYYGQVKIEKFSYDTSTGQYTSAGVEYLNEPTGSSWTYNVTDDAAYKYVVTYQTKVDQTKVDQSSQNHTLTNIANGKEGTYYVTPADSLVLRKAVESSNTSEVNWIITLDVPDAGLDASSGVLIDDLPNIYLNGRTIYDELTGVVSVDGIDESTESYKIDTDTTGKVVITFYKDKAQSTVGLNRVTGGRTVTVRLTTKVNEEWLAASYDEDTQGWERWWLSHTNNVKVGSATASETVVYAAPGITKTAPTGLTTYTESSWGGGNETKVEHQCLVYTIVVSGVSDDKPLVVTDTFDTSLLQVAKFNVQPQDDQMRILGGEQWSQGYGGNDYHATYTETADGIIITANRLPRQENGSYYSHYKITYLLEPKEGVDLSKLAQQNEGSYTVNNTASWEDQTADSSYTTTYDFLKKELTNEGELSTQTPTATSPANRTAEYKITFNDAAAALNHGESMPMTDVLSSNLAIIPTSIQVYSVDDNGVETPRTDIPYKIDYTEGSQTQVTYTIPDKTHIVIKYKATILGNGTVNFTNTVQIKGRTIEKVSKSNVGNSGDGVASNIMLHVLKADGDSLGTVLKDVEFEFFAEDESLRFDSAGEVQVLHFKTDENGQFTIDQNSTTLAEMPVENETTGARETPQIFYNTRYHLREVNPPAGYRALGFDYLVTFTDDYAKVDHVMDYVFYTIDYLHIENWPLEGLVIEKRVDSASQADKDGEYTFEVAILNDDGSVNEDFNGKYGSTTFVNGVAKHTDSDGDEVGLKDGEQWVILGLPAGTKYQVTETTTGYTTSYVAERGRVTSTDGTTTYTGKDTGDGTTYKNDTDGIPAEGADYIVFTNTSTGSLLLSKLVTVDSHTTGDTLADGTYTFTITGPTQKNATTGEEEPIAGVEQINKQVAITIENGAVASATYDGSAATIVNGYVEVPGLHPGNYTISETTPTNGTSLSKVEYGTTTVDSPTSATNALVTVTAGSTGTSVAAEGTAQFTNNINTGDLKLTKHVTSDLATDAGEVFTFTISLFTDPAMQTPADITRTFGSVSFEHGVARGITLTKDGFITATGLPEGLYYTIVEDAHAGFTLTGSTIDGTTYSGSITNGVSGRTKTGTTNVEFTNTRETGGFKVAKTVSSELAADKSTPFSFTVTLSDTTVNGNFGTIVKDATTENVTFTNGVATFTLADVQQANFTNLPVGVTYTVAETAADGFTTTWNNSVTNDATVSGAIDKDSTPTITATNTRERGGLQVRKTVVSTEETDRATNYSFTVKFYLDPEETTDRRPASNISGAVVFAGGTYDSTSTPRADQSFTGGEATFTLTHTETATISNLPTGIYYEVTEATSSLSNMTTASSASKGTIVASTTMDNSTSVYTNTRNLGGLTVSKSVVSATATDKTCLYSFTVKLFTDPDRNTPSTHNGAAGSIQHADGTTSDLGSFTDGEITFTLTDGDIAILDHLPAGDYYRVTENDTSADPTNGIDTSAFSTSVMSQTGVIEAGRVSEGYIKKAEDTGGQESAIAAFTNTRLGSLTVTKAVTIGGADPAGSTLADGTYTFKVTGPSYQNGHEVELTVTNGVAASKTLENLIPGSYTVQETSGPSGSKVSLDTTVYPVEVAAGANGTLAREVVITNNLGSGNLTVQKTVENAVLSTDTTTPFTFTVKLDQSLTGQYGNMNFENGETTFTLTASQTKVATGLPVGVGYTVTERSVDGFELTKINDTTATDPTTAKADGTISSNNSNVIFTNTRERGGFTVKKGVTSTNTTDTSTRLYSFTVTLYTNAELTNVATGIKDTGTEGAFITIGGGANVRKPTFTNGRATFQLANNEQAVFAGLPAGLYYKVEETAPDGFTTIWSSTSTIDGDTSTSGAITKDGNPTITAKNYAPGSLLINKAVVLEVNGATAADPGTRADGTYRFTVSGPRKYTDGTLTPEGFSTTTNVAITIKNGSILSGTVNGVAATIRTIGDTKYIEVPNLRAGYYEISEQEPSNGTTLTGATGYSVSASNVVTVLVSSGDTGLNVPNNGRATFTNTMATGALEFTKNVHVNGDNTTTDLADGSYVFRVVGPTNSDATASMTTQMVSITITNGQPASAVVNGKSATMTSDNHVKLEGLAPGTYTITEVSTPVDTTLESLNVTGGTGDRGNWTATVQVSADSTASIPSATFLNNAQTAGSLKLMKLVSFGGVTVGEGSTRANGDYTFTVTGPIVTDETSGATTYGSTRSVVITIENGVARNATLTTDGAADSNIKIGSDGYVELTNLTPGTYEVQETVPQNMSLRDILTGGRSDRPNNKVTLTVTGGVVGDAVTGVGTATFTNSLDTGVLLVTKNVEGGRDKDGDIPFTFTVMLTNGSDITGVFGDMVFDDGVATVTLKHGETAKAEGLPAGTTYTVTEGAIPGFTTAVVGTGTIVSGSATGEISSTASSTATFTNTRGWGSLTLTKQVTLAGVDPAGSTLADGTYTFEVVGPISGGTAETQRVELKVENGEAVSKTLDDLPAGDYTVQEVASSNPHVPVNETVYEVEVVDGATGSAAVKQTIVNNVTFGNLKVTKTVTSETKGDANAEFSFTVTLSDATINGTFGDMTFVNGVATIKLKDGGSAVATGLPSGIKYEVVESALPNGFAQGDHQNTTGTITANKTMTADMRNVYTPETPDTPGTPSTPTIVPTDTPSTPTETPSTTTPATQETTPQGAVPQMGDTTQAGLVSLLLAAGVVVAGVGLALASHGWSLGDVLPVVSGRPAPSTGAHFASSVRKRKRRGPSHMRR